MAKIQSIAIRVGLDLKDLLKGTDKAGAKLNSLKKNAAGLAKGVGIGLAAAAATAGVAAIKMATDFNRSMSQVNTLLGGNTARTKELKQEVEKLALQTGKSTMDIAAGLYDTVSAFGDSADSAKILETAVLAAGAAGDTTQSAVALLSATMKGYGDINAETANKVADLAFGTVRLGQTTLPELSSAFQGVVGVASASGVRMEEFFAVMATGTGVLGGAAEVSTKLNSFMTALQKPSKELTQVMNEMGYETGKAWIEGEGLMGAMSGIMDHSKKTGNTLIKYTRRTEGAQLVQQMAGASAETYAQKLGELENASGELSTAVSAQRGGVGKLGFAFDKLKASGQVLMQVLGDGLGAVLQTVVVPIAEALAKWVGKLRDRFKEWGQQTQDSTTVMGRLSASFDHYKAVMLELWSVVQPIIQLIGERIKWAAATVWDALKIVIDVFGLVTDVIYGSINTIAKLLRGDFSGAMDAMRAMWESVWHKVQAIVIRAADMVLRTLENLLGMIPGVGDRIAKWREGLAAQMEQIGKNQAAAEVAIVQESADAQVEAANAGGADMVAALQQSTAAQVATVAAGAEAMVAETEKGFDAQLAIIQGAGVQQIEAQRGVLAAVEPAWINHFGRQKESAATGWAGILEKFRTGTGDVVSLTGTKFGNLITKAQGLMGKVGGLEGILGGGITSILGAAGPWGAALQAGIGLLETFGIDAQALMGKVMRGIGKAVLAAKNFIVNAFKTIWDSVKGVIEGIGDFIGSFFGNGSSNDSNPDNPGGAGGYHAPSDRSIRALPPGDTGPEFGQTPASSPGGGVFQQINIDLDGDTVATAVLRGLPRQAKLEGTYS